MVALCDHEICKTFDLELKFVAFVCFLSKLVDAQRIFSSLSSPPSTFHELFAQNLCRRITGNTRNGASSVPSKSSIQDPDEENFQNGDAYPTWHSFELIYATIICIIHGSRASLYSAKLEVSA